MTVYQKSGCKTSCELKSLYRHASESSERLRTGRRLKTPPFRQPAARLSSNPDFYKYASITLALHYSRKPP